MPQGDPGGHYAESGGYPGGTGGMPGGGGSASGHFQGAGPQHGMLGFGTLSPGGFHSGTYANNLGLAQLGGQGPGGIAGAIARGRAIRARNAAGRKQSGTGLGQTGAQKPGVVPTVTTPPTKIPPEEVIPSFWSGYDPLSSIKVPKPSPNVMSGSFFPGTSINVNPPNPPINVQSGSAFPGESMHHGPPTPAAATGPGSGWSGMFNDAIGGLGNWGSLLGGLHNAASQGWKGKQFGGPVDPGQRYTVGENGPETLQMNPGGGGQVIPNNPADRLGGMNPQLMQQMFQLMQQRPQMNPAQAPAGQPAPAMPPRGFGLGGPQQPPQIQPSRQVGDWRQQMGIAGLSRPNMGFGGSGLGVPGVMGQLRQQMGT